ncbi:lipase family protein [Streptomyces sp. NBC_00193]|uniref:hypothetical protein n=1 Tax=unclassified Streptomyces TaxID=2593676 RepID=UPI00224D1BBC|nr:MULTISPECIES: hypothetical protein [unclassified Streptomyces]MCX5122297.1 lipase family protein [Streptomyces sp. NBC_00347]MCX5295643.1 lipase family protein [Streptomyces sp. NBC_00193]
MSVIVGVHGIAQQQLGRGQLAAVWSPSLTDGVEAALSGRRVAELPFDLAYYGRLFLDATGRTGTGARAGTGTKAGAAAEDPADLAELSHEEQEELLAAAHDAAGAQAFEASATQATKGYSRVPRPFQVAFRALDWRFGPGAALLFVGAFRQVRSYLRDPELKAGIDAVVDASVTADTRVLVGHSLGSVVAFEFVRRHPRSKLDLLLTVGSPLGTRFVRALMAHPDHGASGLPPGLKEWVNVRDARDPVAFAGDLSEHWPRVRDVTVDNGGDAHAVSRYLSKKQTGAAVLEALPDLAR